MRRSCSDVLRRSGAGSGGGWASIIRSCSGDSGRSSSGSGDGDGGGSLGLLGVIFILT